MSACRKMDDVIAVFLKGIVAESPGKKAQLRTNVFS